MPSWWPKTSSSSKEKKKREKESFFDSFQRKSKSNPTNSKCRNHEFGSKSQAVSRSPSPSRNIARCQSFSDPPLSQPLPLPSKPKQRKSSRSSRFPPIPKPSCIRSKRNVADLDIATASVSSGSSSDSDGVACSSRRSPQATDSDQPLQKMNSVTTHSAPGGDPSKKPANVAVQQATPASSRRRPIMPHLKVPTFFSAPDSSLSSPSRSPMRMFPTYHEVNFLSSGQGSSPGSGYNSGQNSMAGEASGQLFLQPSRGSPEYSPVPSPRMNSPGPGSRVHSGAVTPIHPRAGPTSAEIQSHRLPLPPILTVPRSPGWTDNQTIPGSRWKKGKLLGRGTFGHVYVGYNSDNGKMCAMKEVTLCSDDAKSMECTRQLIQEISLLSRLSHPNIVQYFGSETVGDKLYIYLEYVSGGSIYKILQEYGQLGEIAIRSYTQQILSGLAYLHSKNTVHRDIKGANILVDPNGRVKLVDFGMAKHIRGQTCPLSFKGSPYWMAPEVIKNSNGCSLAVDIWSLGCTVLEMATTKPPWSQFEGVAAMFKIGNSKDLPVIPDHLSDEGKDFVRLCLQRNPQHRPTASQLLEHHFVKGISSVDPPERNPTVFHSSRYPRPNLTSRLVLPGRTEMGLRLNPVGVCSDLNAWRNISCPVSPVSSPIVRQHFASPISSPKTTSGSSTPLTSGVGVNAPVMSGGCGRYQLPARGVSARYDGQSVLADRVSKQLLNRPIKLNPSVDLNPMRNRPGQ